MDVIDKINYLLDEKSMSKKEFAHRLQALEPRLKSTGKIPNIQTIYGYLSGKRELKVELIPFIAEVLGVKEQELFSNDLEYATEYNYRYTKEVREMIELLPYAPKGVLTEFIELLERIKKDSRQTMNSIKSRAKHPSR